MDNPIFKIRELLHLSTIDRIARDQIEEPMADYFCVKIDVPWIGWMYMDSLIFNDPINGFVHRRTKLRITVTMENDAIHFRF